MSTLERVFIKEFNRSIRSRGVVKNIYEVPLPKEVENWDISGEELYIVNGLNEESCDLYYGLKGTIVKRLPRGMVASRRKIDLVKRDFVRDVNNRYVYEDVKVPNGSMVVISDKNLNLPFGYKSTEDGFGYIDFVTDGVNREYMYYIPKKYLYQTHQTALALSVKNMKNFFGMGYVSWDFGTIFLHVIPYKPNANYVGSKILKTSLSTNYNKEIKSIVDFWINNNIIPRIALCDTEENGNLVLKETARGYEVYNPIEETSVGDREVYGSKVMEDGEEL